MATVVVRYFAAARELAGSSEERLEVPDEGMSGEAFRTLLAARHERLAPLLPRMRLARNGELADTAERVAGGDEIDVLPPVAGGSAVSVCAIRETPLSIDEVFSAVLHPGAGGVVIFTGVVRDHAEGRAVERLDYESHPTLAEREMRRVLEGIVAELPGVRLAATHRVGALAIGDLAVVVAASAPHRSEAFSACRLAIDRIKETVPIWKKEWARDGAGTWVNLGE